MASIQKHVRAGNHAFARLYNQIVPDTWHVINDRDAVPRMGKFFFLFKRPGQRVSTQPTLQSCPLQWMLHDHCRYNESLRSPKEKLERKQMNPESCMILAKKHMAAGNLKVAHNLA